MPDTTDIITLGNANADADGSGAAAVLELSSDEKQRYSEHTPVASPSGPEFLKLVLDESNMYVAPLPITNGSEDRDGEVTDPDGLMDSAYRKSPVVFFNHSHKFAPMLPAIGTAETPDREYDVHRTDQGWSSGCRFAQSHKLGSQCFAMVAEGLLRARSIGALNHELAPYRPQAPGVTFHEGKIRPVRTKSVTHTLYELVEWSWVFIPSNRDMVVEAKSLLSRDCIQGERLDPGLKMMIKSLDLQEPVSSAEHTGSGLFQKHFDRAFSSKENEMNPTIVAVRFSTDHYNPLTARESLKSFDGTVDTDLTTEEVDGELFLRSTQVHHTGDVSVSTDERFPGVQLLYTKGGLFDKDPEDPEDSKPSDDEERAAVEEIIEQATGKVQVNEDGEEATEEKASAPDDVAVVDENDEELTGPMGSKYLRTWAKKLASVMDLAEASTGELEPEMMEKCGEIASGIREKIEDINSYHKSRYEVGDEEAVDESPEDKKPETPEEAAMRKSLQTDLFFGKRHALPSSFLESIRAVHGGLDGVQGASSAQKSLGVLLKGLSEPVRQPAVRRPSKREELEEQVIRRLKEEAEARNREIL